MKENPVIFLLSNSSGVLVQMSPWRTKFWDLWGKITEPGRLPLKPEQRFVLLDILGLKTSLLLLLWAHF